MHPFYNKLKELLKVWYFPGASWLITLIESTGKNRDKFYSTKKEFFLLKISLVKVDKSAVFWGLFTFTTEILTENVIFCAVFVMIFCSIILAEKNSIKGSSVNLVNHSIPASIADQIIIAGSQKFSL